MDARGDGIVFREYMNPFKKIPSYYFYYYLMKDARIVTNVDPCIIGVISFHSPPLKMSEKPLLHVNRFNRSIESCNIVRYINISQARVKTHREMTP